MQKSDLTCLFFPDLLPWERCSLDPLLAHLSSRYRIEQWDVTQLSRDQLKEARRGENIWVVANRWQQALQFLSVPTKAKVYVSVLGPVSSPDTLATLVWRRFRPLVAPSVQLIAHSPLSYRFLREIQHVPENQVSFVPLPAQPDLKPSLKPRADGTITVGTLARFSSESNLNYFLGVAHYVAHHNPALRFRILGAGLLAPHVQELVQGLDLSGRVKVDISRESFDASGLDIFLYTPLQNEHFIPLIVAGSLGLPVIASEVPGIDQFILDGREGFLVAVNDIRPMGELILRLAADPLLRGAVGEKLSERVFREYSSQKIGAGYEKLFFGKTESPTGVTQAA